LPGAIAFFERSPVKQWHKPAALQAWQIEIKFIFRYCPDLHFSFVVNKKAGITDVTWKASRYTNGRRFYKR
jgi:hypothetical protein